MARARVVTVAASINAARRSFSDSSTSENSFRLSRLWRVRFTKTGIIHRFHRFFKERVLVWTTVPLSLCLTPKAFANFSPRLERSDNLGIGSSNFDLTLKRVRQSPNPFQGFICFVCKPKVVATLQPWAQISQRLRRN